MVLGNGTGSREALQVVEGVLERVNGKKKERGGKGGRKGGGGREGGEKEGGEVGYLVVDEAGASVYSASDVAREVYIYIYIYIYSVCVCLYNFKKKCLFLKY